MKWVESYMKMNLKTTIYCSKEALDLLTMQWPSSDRRVYIVRDIKSFVVSKWNWTYDELTDSERGVGHSEVLYKTWSEKTFMVEDSTFSSPLRTKYFAWVDTGALRSGSRLYEFKGFPDPHKLVPSKVGFLQVQNFTFSETLSLGAVDSRLQRVGRIGGGHFAGDSGSLLKFAKIHRKTVSEFKKKGVLAGKDQSLFAFEVLRYPSLLVAHTYPDINYDRWFMLHFMWSTNFEKSGVDTPRPERQVLPAEPDYSQLSGSQCMASLVVLTTVDAYDKRSETRSGWLGSLLKKYPSSFDYKFLVEKVNC